MKHRHIWSAALLLLLLGTAGLAASGDAGVTWRTDDSPLKLTVDDPIYLRAAQTKEPVPSIPIRAGLLRAPQSAEIIVDYQGPWSGDARAAFEYAVSIWERQLSSSVPIRVEAEWAALPSGVLGGAGPYYSIRNFSGAPQGNTWYPAALANSLAGQDLNTTYPDIIALFNSDFGDWYFGLNGNPPGDKYDFVTVVLHELGHGLGFTGSMEVDDGFFSNGLECFGSANYGCWGFNNGSETGSPAIFDRFARNSFDQQLVDESLFDNPSFALSSQLRSNAISFDGPAARAANSGSPPRLYTPSTWRPGSSFAHLDEDVFPPGTPNALMTPFLANGEALHDPGDITRGIFSDVGWTSLPTLRPLPSQLMELGETRIGAIDLWQYASDEDTPTDALEFSMTTTDALAGVAIRNNRYIDIEPTTTLPLEAIITVTVTDAQTNTASQQFWVVIVEQVGYTYFPFVEQQ